MVQKDSHKATGKSGTYELEIKKLIKTIRDTAKISKQKEQN
jgi:hypothetical protein